ncbi:MAG TPA: hypothetical protein VGX37_09700 [Allosphingosinicella sp.]|nr:hypothetical protein [Allosphingosinicella sp.]
MATGQDRRARRTRPPLIQALNRLLLNRRREKIRVADIIARADAARAEADDEFADVGEAHMEALARPFAILADAAAGQGDPERLTALLDHFWENRQRARATLSGRTGDKAIRLLGDMVAARLQRRQIALVLPLRLAALQLAYAAIGPLRAWVGGEASCRSATLAQSICRCGDELVESLAATPVTLVPRARAMGG